RGEVERLLELFPRHDRKRILYTSNFAPRTEFTWALKSGVTVTVDNSYAFEAWPSLFEGRDIFLRADTASGRAHHTHLPTPRRPRLALLHPCRGAVSGCALGRIDWRAGHRAPGPRR